MICAINIRQDATHHESTKIKPPFLPYDKPDLYNNYILKDPEYTDLFYIHFPCHCILNQIDSNTDLLDNVLLTKDVLQPTKKSRSVGQYKLKSEKTTSKKTRLKKKFRIVSTQLHEEPRSIKIQFYKYAKSKSDKENMLQQRLFYNTNESEELSMYRYRYLAQSTNRTVPTLYLNCT